jgi:hypothetical protein
MTCKECDKKDELIAGQAARLDELRGEIESMRDTHALVIESKDEEIAKLKRAIV